MKQRISNNPGYDDEISSDELRSVESEEQLEIMREWFYERYEDPVNRTPYQSSEGGYIYIWGGPYSAQDVLHNRFVSIVPDDVINELVDEVEGVCWEWAPTPKPSDYDDYLIDDIARITEYYHNFTSAILDVEKILETDIDGSVSDCFYRLLYVNVITALETFLSDAFIKTVVPDKTLMRNFIETTPEFQSQKVPLSEVLKVADEIESKAKSYLIDVVWHNLDRVKLMYRDTLNVSFPEDTGDIFRAILLRHDIVHRNGKTKDGDEILVFKNEIKELISGVESFAQYIDNQIGAL